MQFLTQPIPMLLIAVCFGASGQMLIKTGINEIVKETGKLEGLIGLIGAFTHPKVFAGFGCYGVSSLLYLKVLEKSDLSYAYPMIASSYVIVTILSYFFFREQIPPLRIVGLALVCLGVALIGQSAVPKPQVTPAIQQEASLQR